MYSRINNSITIKSNRIVEKFKTAAVLFAQSGLSIPVGKVIEVMILSELNRLDPNEIAERSIHNLINTSGLQTA